MYTAHIFILLYVHFYICIDTGERGTNTVNDLYLCKIYCKWFSERKMYVCVCVSKKSEKYE